MKYFTKIFRDQLVANPNVLDSVDLELVLFRTAPSGGYDYSAIPTVKKLMDGNYPGWDLIPHAVPYSSPVRVAPRTVGSTTYTEAAYFILTGLTYKVEASAIGIQAKGNLWGEVNPLIMVSNEMFPDGRTNVDKDDMIMMLKDEKVAGAAAWLLSWGANNGATPPVNLTGQQRSDSLTMGEIILMPGPPDYQAAHHFEVWMYPQRVNYIANPSFESTVNKYWATNGAFSRVPSPAGGFAGQFTGESLTIETNTFPIDLGKDGIWTIQFLIKGTGLLSVGLISWTGAYDATYADWGKERWQLDSETMLQVRVTRTCNEAVEGMLRLQVDGSTEVIIDKVLAEPGALTDWWYFDGDEQYGAPDDFSWYGDRGESYSLWYNNRRSIVSRLFAKHSYEGSVNVETDPHGLAYNWVAAGTDLEYNLDVLRPWDLKTPPIPKTGVMPDDVTDPIFGVPGGSQNVLTTTSALVLTTAGEEVYVAKAP